MTSEAQIVALKRLANFVTNSPTMETLVKAENLLQILTENPDDFWDSYFLAVSGDGPYKEEAEQLMATFGTNATFADMVQFAHDAAPAAAEN